MVVKGHFLLKKFKIHCVYINGIYSKIALRCSGRGCSPAQESEWQRCSIGMQRLTQLVVQSFDRREKRLGTTIWGEYGPNFFWVSTTVWGDDVHLSTPHSSKSLKLQKFINFRSPSPRERVITTLDWLAGLVSEIPKRTSVTMFDWWILRPSQIDSVFRNG